jgi:alpha-L-fucosidase
MLREVLTGYGKIFEVWLDGANGEGPNGKRQEYDWGLFHRTIRECQPDAVIFSDVGPDCRWIGNERGVAGTTNWSRLDTVGYTPGLGAPPTDTLNQGNILGAAWVPGEADVSIRKGWFYGTFTGDESEDLKSVGQLLDIYETSVGRNANLLLNVPPDRNGRITTADSLRLMEFRDAREAVYTHNLAESASERCLLDGDFDTWWAADNTDTSTIEISLGSPKAFDRIVLQEYIALGQRVAEWNVEYLGEDGAWVPLATATTIGYKRILQVAPTVSSRLRINITHSLAPPIISEVGVYYRK